MAACCSAPYLAGHNKELSACVFHSCPLIVWRHRCASQPLWPTRNRRWFMGAIYKCFPFRREPLHTRRSNTRNIVASNRPLGVHAALQICLWRYFRIDLTLNQGTETFFYFVVVVVLFGKQVHAYMHTYIHITTITREPWWGLRIVERSKREIMRAIRQ